MANHDLLNLADIRARDFKLVLLASLKIILRVKGTFFQKMTSIDNFLIPSLLIICHNP